MAIEFAVPADSSKGRTCVAKISGFESFRTKSLDAIAQNEEK